MSSSRLYLLRHAKACFAAPGMRDFDRPLETSGRQDAEWLGQQLSKQDWIPSLVLCSTGKRAAQTWEIVAATLGNSPEVRRLDELYSADAAGYLSIIQRSQAHGAVMVVGHNPMLEDLALALGDPADDLTDKIRKVGFPTAGLAVLDFATPLAEIQPASGKLSYLLRPADREV